MSESNFFVHESSFVDENVFLETLKMYFTDLNEADLTILDYNQVLIKSEVSAEDKAIIQNYYDNSASNIISIQE